MGFNGLCLAEVASLLPPGRCFILYQVYYLPVAATKPEAS